MTTTRLVVVVSVERAIDIAHHHLDFLCFSGHSHWHDTEPMEGGRESQLNNRFRCLEEGWKSVQDLIAGADDADDFSAFPGFEWHSSAFGDRCVVFAEDHRPLLRADELETLRGFCHEGRALKIPLAYPEGAQELEPGRLQRPCSPVERVRS